MTEQNRQTSFGPLLGGDFTAFYNAGTIFYQQSPAQVYVSAVQAQTFHQLFPTTRSGLFMPYANAPFLTFLFGLLARFPYPIAYLLWLLCSFSCYIGGFALLWRSLDVQPRRHQRTILLLALSFTPFLLDTWIGGQTTTLAFCALAAAIYFERRTMYGYSGAVLALCVYKLPLLFLIGPMLVVTRRLRTLLGFAIGLIILVGISWFWFGYTGLRNYVDMLFAFKDTATVTEEGARIWKFIDINAFSRLLLTTYPMVRLYLNGIVLVSGLLLLLWFWLRTPRQARDAQTVLWAITIAATLILNLYSGFYEATLLVLSVLLFTHARYRYAATEPDVFSPGYQILLVLLYVTPWFSQPLARVTGVQTYTLITVAFILYQMRWLYQLLVYQPDVR